MIIKLSQGLCDFKCLLSPPLNSKVTGGILDKHHQPMGCCFLWEAKKAVELAVIFPTQRNSSKLSYIPHGCNPSQKKKPETTEACFTFFFVHHCKRNYSVKQTFWQNNHFYWMGINSISFKSWRCVICTSTPNVQYIQFIPVQSLFLPPLPTPFAQIFSGKHAVHCPHQLFQMSKRMAIMVPYLENAKINCIPGIPFSLHWLLSEDYW